MTFRRLWRVAIAVAFTAALLTVDTNTSLVQPASAATAESIAALALANLGKGAGACSTVSSSDNSLGGSQFDGSCTGTDGGPEYWCSDFVKWVWQNADNGKVNVVGLNASAASFYSYGTRNGTLHDSSSYRPQVGDAIVYGYGYGGAGTAIHVGLVASINSDGTITTINGDWGGGGEGGMAEFAETSKVETTTLQADEVAVGSKPSWMSYRISAYITPVTTTTPNPVSACTSTALTKALIAANPQLNSYKWKLRSYACGSGWAVAQVYAPAVGPGTAFLQQTTSGWKSDGLGEVSCSQIPGPLATPLPPRALAVSLLKEAGICSQPSASTPSAGPTPSVIIGTAGICSGCVFHGTKPKEIYFSGDNTVSIRGIIWSSWDAAGAIGNGTWYLVDCNPNCAQGPVTKYPASLKFSDVKQGVFTVLTTTMNGKTATYHYPDPSWPQYATG